MERVLDERRKGMQDRGGSLERWIDTNRRWVMLAPAVIVLLVLVAFPTVYMFTVAFQKFNPAQMGANEFIGLDNFARLLTDQKFHNALKNTLVFTASAVTLEFLLGLGFALLVDKYLQRLTFIKTILLIPMMLPPIAVALNWRLLLQPRFGVVNDLLGRVFGLEPVLWTAKTGTAMISLIIVDVWEWTPFVFLMVLAGLAGLPREPYEAADMDGANAWHKFRDLTWPFLKPVIAIVVLLRVMDAFRIFDQVFILTRGGPAGATETLSLYLYKIAFQFFDLGYASAMSLFMLVLTIGFSTIFLLRLKLD